MTPLTVWGRRSAFNVQKVLWFLGELGITFTHHNAGGSFGGLSSPDFLAMNPHARVPVLKDGELIVWESHAILRYLAATYGGEGFWSASPAVRARIDGWMDWAQTTLQPDFMRLFWGFYRMPTPQRNNTQIKAAQAQCDQHFRRINEWLGQYPYLAGPEFTLADVPAGTALYRYFEMGLDVVCHSHVMEWYARLAERSGYREHVMVPFGELQGRLEF